MEKTIVAAILSFVVASSTSAEPQATKISGCRIHAPVTKVTGTAFYSDAAGSKLNHTRLNQHLAEIEPLREFAKLLIANIDAGHLDCSLRNLERWAAESALMAPTRSFTAIRERQRFTFAINMAALKLIWKGGNLSPQVRAWLTRLNRQVMQDFTNRKPRDNLYIWSGATAGVGYRITGDEKLKHHAMGVWRNGTDEIEDDGQVPSELRRQSRVVMYHAYYMAGIMVLERSLFGRAIEDPRLERLYERVRAWTCDPASSDSLSNEGPQVRPNPDDFALIAAFRPDGPPLCGGTRALRNDPLRGGVPGEAVQLLSRSH